MKKIMERKRSKPLSKDDLEEYLESIKFDERSEQGTLSDKELKKILHDNLEKYFQGTVTRGFIMGLSSAIYEECQAGGCSENDDTLMTVTCMIEDLYFPHLRKSPIKEVFRSALNMLEKGSAAS